jgi:hypothetical protein
MFLLLLAAHFIGDFAFQSSWMSIEKGKSHEICFYHAATYTSTFILLCCSGIICILPLWAFGVLLISHFIIDELKSRYQVIKTVWEDQLCHFIFLLLIYYWR